MVPSSITLTLTSEVALPSYTITPHSRNQVGSQAGIAALLQRSGIYRLDKFLEQRVTVVSEFPLNPKIAESIDTPSQ
jgi:hypothetical protein